MQEEESKKEITLEYFACRGRGVALRLFLTDSGIPWTDVVVPLDDQWAGKKGNSGAFGTVPLLHYKHNDKTIHINEVLAIAAFLSQAISSPPQSSSPSTDALLTWGESMQVVSKAHLDISVALNTLLWAPVRMVGVDLADQVRRLKASVMVTFSTFESKFFFDGRLFVCATDQPTIGDYFLFEAIDRLLLVLSSAEVLKDFPLLTAYHTRMLQRPRVREFMDNNRELLLRCSGSPAEEKIRSELASHW